MWIQSSSPRLKRRVWTHSRHTEQLFHAWNRLYLSGSLKGLPRVRKMPGRQQRDAPASRGGHAPAGATETKMDQEEIANSILNAERAAKRWFPHDV